MRVRFLIDGFNVYHSLKEARGSLGGVGTKWLDLTSFCSSQLQLFGKLATLETVQYFSALATHLQSKSPSTVARHQRYISCLEDTGVKTQLGRFKRARGLHCKSCGSSFARNEEKETDVAIAVALLEGFFINSCDYVVLVTGDTDLVPAVLMARRLFPTKGIGFVFPYGRSSKELKKLADAAFSISAHVYAQHQFSDPYTMSDGSLVSKPPGW